MRLTPKQANEIVNQGTKPVYAQFKQGGSVRVYAISYQRCRGANNYHYPIESIDHFYISG